MEKAYFGMDYLRVTNGPHGVNSHKDSEAIDLGGKDTGIDNFYAPYSGVVKRLRTNSNEVWFESSDKVLYADGTIDYMTILLIHCSNVPVSQGQAVKQGELLYSEGTKGNVTGAHIHFEVAKGQFVSPYGWYKVGYGNDGSEIWNIYNQYPVAKALWLKPTCTILNAGTDNTSGATLQWTVDTGSDISNLDYNSYFTVNVSNCEYFSACDVNTNLGYLENGKTYVAYSAYVGTDFTWWRFRHPDGNLYWCAMIWSRMSAYGVLPITYVSDKVVQCSAATTLYAWPDPWNPTQTVIPNGQSVTLIATFNISVYDKNFAAVSLGDGTTGYVVLSDTAIVSDPSVSDNFAALPANSILTVGSSDVYYYSSPDPSKAVGQISAGTIVSAIRITTTGILGYNWYEIYLDDSTTAVYVVVNDSQLTLSQRSDPTPVDPDYTAKLVGIDVSKYQGTINWNNIKTGDTNNIKFVFARVVSSNNAGLYVDPQFITNIHGAQAIGLPTGAYIYTYGESASEIDAELTLAFAQFQGETIGYPIGWDMEDSATFSKHDKAFNTTLALYALNKIKSAGYLPLLYTYTSFANNYINAADIESAGFGVWAADYRGYCGYPEKYQIWQYASDGNVYGIDGNCDMNISYFDFQRYISDKSLNGSSGGGSGTVTYPTTSSVGALTVTATNAECFPYPSVDAEGNYYLKNGYTYSIIAKCDNQYNGFSWYVILDSGKQVYVPYISGRMEIDETKTLQCPYAHTLSGTKLWISAYESMEYFKSVDVSTNEGYLTKDHPYHIYARIPQSITSSGNAYQFLVIQLDDGSLHYCCDFSGAMYDKCEIYTADIAYPYMPADFNSKLYTDSDSVPYYEMPSTTISSNGMLMKNQRYSIIGQLIYPYNRRTWYLASVNGSNMYIEKSESVVSETSEYDIPYTYIKEADTIAEVISQVSSYQSISESSVQTPMSIDRCYPLYCRIIDESTGSDIWHGIVINGAIQYIKEDSAKFSIYTGSAYPESSHPDQIIITKDAIPYFDIPTLSETTQAGEYPAGTIFQSVYEVTRTMVGGKFYRVGLDSASATKYIQNGEDPLYIGAPFDGQIISPDDGYFIKSSNAIDYYAYPHIYSSASGRIASGLKLSCVGSIVTSIDGNTWEKISVSDGTFGYIPVNVYKESGTISDGYEYESISDDPLHYVSGPLSCYAYVSMSAPVVAYSGANLLISAKLSSQHGGLTWYMAIVDGSKVYIPEIGNNFYYDYKLEKMKDGATAVIAVDGIVGHDRPSASDTANYPITKGSYQIDAILASPEVPGNWVHLIVPQTMYLQLGTNVTVAYVYTEESVDSHLSIITTSDIVVHVYADPDSASTMIPAGMSLAPMSKISNTNGATWYKVSWNGQEYYVDISQTGYSENITYQGTPATEGSIITVVSDVDGYSTPGDITTAVALPIGEIYTVVSYLTDTFSDGYRYASAMDTSGGVFYVRVNETGLTYSFDYPKTQLGTTDSYWLTVKKGDSVYLYTNPIEGTRAVAESIPLNAKLQVAYRLNKTYNGKVWYQTVGSSYFGGTAYVPYDEASMDIFDQSSAAIGDAIDEIRANLDGVVSELTGAISSLTAEMSTVAGTLISKVKILSEQTTILRDNLKDLSDHIQH